MKAVTGGMMWTILIIIIGIVAVALLYLFITGAAESITGVFEELVENFKQAIGDLIGGLIWKIFGF